MGYLWKVLIKGDDKVKLGGKTAQVFLVFDGVLHEYSISNCIIQCMHVLKLSIELFYG